MYLKRIINILPSFEQDGPKLIYYIITNMHVESILSTRDLLQDLGSLELKKFSYNIKKLHAGVHHLVAQLKVNKAEPDNLTIMMHLIAVGWKDRSSTFRTNKAHCLGDSRTMLIYWIPTYHPNSRGNGHLTMDRVRSDGLNEASEVLRESSDGYGVHNRKKKR